MLIKMMVISGICFFIITGTRNGFVTNPEPTTTPEQTPIAPEPASIAAQDNGGDTFLVTRAVDGDTIELEDGNRVRYIGVDTPESVDPRKPVQCFGKEASERNKELVKGKRARLERDVSETDRYGRLLRYVYVGNQLINLILVQEGFAHSYTYPPDVAHQKEFAAAERTAREAKKGLWGECPVVHQ